MKSRTSFFNRTVLRKDITRYAPVWGLYTIGLLLFLLITNLDNDPGDMADVLGSSISSLAVVHMILGGISALLVFGDLFKTRLCYATHALPLRREGWFLTHFTAGFLFSFVPNLFISLCFLPLVLPYWYMVPLWLASNTLQYLFFFGIASFCVVCAGNRLGATAAYLILNFGTLLVGWYAENIYTPLLYGMEFQWNFLNWLMPVSQIVDLDMVEYAYRPFQFGGCIHSDWLYLGIIAVVGLLLAVFAILIYRKRHMETAGDFLSLPAAKPVFLIIYTLAIGYLFSELLAWEYLGMFAGLLVGFFTGKMLLERTIKVFRGWNFLQFGIFVTLIGLSIGLTALDPVGLTRYVPKTNDVEVLYFYDSSDSHLYTNDTTEGRVISDPAEIDKFLQFHEDITDGRYTDSTENTVRVYLHYELKNGNTVLRSYDIPVASAHGEFTRTELSSWKSVFHINDWEAFINRIEQVDVEINAGMEITHHMLTDREQVRGLLEAVKADCEAGNMARNWNYHQEDDTSSWLYIYDDNFKITSEKLGTMPIAYTLSLNVFTSCENTIAYLDSLDLDLEPYEK